MFNAFFENILYINFTNIGYEEIVGHSTLVHVRFPEAGTYKLVVYAKEIEMDPTASSAPARESVYGAVCEYKVVATAASVVSFAAGVPAFPPCQNMHYGPLEAARRYQLQPDRRENKIFASAGIVYSEILVF